MKISPLKSIIFVAITAIVGLCVYLSFPSNVERRNAKDSESRLVSRKPATVKDIVQTRNAQLKANPNPAKRIKKKRDRSKIPDELSVKERTVLNSVDEALNKGDLDKVIELTQKLQNSTNEIARLRAVEALGWFEDDALPELTLFLVDEDEGVRYAARDQWMAAIDQVKDMSFKASVIEATMQAVKDPDLLEDIAFHLNDLPTFNALESLVSLINGGNQAAIDAALEEYSFITGKEYTSLEDTQAWVDENIEEDDDSDDDTPVYRASKHPEVFDDTTDLQGVKIVNDTEYEIPPRAGSPEAAKRNKSSSTVAGYSSSHSGSGLKGSATASTDKGQDEGFMDSRDEGDGDTEVAETEPALEGDVDEEDGEASEMPESEEVVDQDELEESDNETGVNGVNTIPTLQRR